MTVFAMFGDGGIEAVCSIKACESLERHVNP